MLGPDEEQARRTARRLWPNDEIPGEAAQLLPLPRHFGQLSQLITEDMISSPCGPDPQAHVSAVSEYADAGFDEVYVGQVGPDQDGFFEFYAREVLPRLRGGWRPQGRPYAAGSRTGRCRRRNSSARCQARLAGAGS